MEESQGDGQVAEQVLPLPRPLLRFTEVTSAAHTTRLEVLPRSGKEALLSSSDDFYTSVNSEAV